MYVKSTCVLYNMKIVGIVDCELSFFVKCSTSILFIANVTGYKYDWQFAIFITIEV